MRRLRTTGALLTVAMAATAALMVTPAAGADEVLAHWIQNASRLRCLQPVDGSHEQGAAIVQMPCDESESEIQNRNSVQFWMPERVGDFTRYKNVKTGLCLDARGGAANHTPIQQWPCNEISNEKWDRPASDRRTIRSRVSGSTSHCLDVPGGSLMDIGLAMQLYRCSTDNQAQFWDTRVPNFPIE